jgi:hypothetical protein
VGATFLILFPGGLAAVVSSKGWHGARGFLLGGFVGILLVVGVLWRDFRHGAATDAQRSTALGIQAAAVGLVGVLFGGRLAILGFCAGAMMVFGMSGLVNLFDAPDPRREEPNA